MTDYKSIYRFMEKHYPIGGVHSFSDTFFVERKSADRCALIEYYHPASSMIRSIDYVVLDEDGEIRLVKNQNYKLVKGVNND